MTMNNEQSDTDLPDIPLPSEEPDKRIKDQFAAGVQFAFVGAGQGGSRLASAFYDFGYRRVCCLNTAEQDLEHIILPAFAKLNLGSGGAGKNLHEARKVYAAKNEDVLDFMRRNFGPAFDRIVVCAGIAGGTGAGTVSALAKTAQSLQDQLKCSSNKVGVIAALPKKSEGKKAHENAFTVLNELLDLVDQKIVSPLILLDNEKIETLYPALSVVDFWNRANQSVAALLHTFNLICVRNSEYTSFDVADWLTLLDSGFIVFGAALVPKWEDATDISYSVRNNLQRNILSGGVDLATGRIAGCVIIGGKDILSKIPQANLEHAFEQFSRIIKAGGTIHRGIYSDVKEALTVFSVIGGLARPIAKLEELKKLGDVLVGNKPGVGPVLGEHQQSR